MGLTSRRKQKNCWGVCAIHASLPMRRPALGNLGTLYCQLRWRSLLGASARTHPDDTAYGTEQA
jgi:hypothetical protein